MQQTNTQTVTVQSKTNFEEQNIDLPTYQNMHNSCNDQIQKHSQFNAEQTLMNRTSIHQRCRGITTEMRQPKLIMPSCMTIKATQQTQLSLSLT